MGISWETVRPPHWGQLTSDQIGLISHSGAYNSAQTLGQPCSQEKIQPSVGQMPPRLDISEPPRTGASAINLHPETPQLSRPWRFPYRRLGTRNRCFWLQATSKYNVSGGRELLALLVDNQTTQENREHDSCEYQEGTIHG